MSETRLDADEIRELIENFPTEVIHGRYALQLLEKHVRDVSSAYEHSPAFSDLVEGLAQLSQSLDEGYEYIDRYLNDEDCDASGGPTSLHESRSPMRISDLNECLREVADCIESCLDDWPSMSEVSAALSTRRAERLEQEVESVWESVRATGYKAHGILIGADFGPNELLFGNYKESPLTSASESPAAANDALDRALTVALSAWADPNQRCAAITIALALTVSPDHVQVHQEESDGDVTAKFERIEVDFRKNIEENSFLWGNAIKHGDGFGTSRYESLPNLAEVYEDHTRNVKCLLDLQRYLPIARDKISKAAVLGLAWARLQRLEISESYRVTGFAESSGHHIHCSSLGVGIRLQRVSDKSEIAGAWYPNISNGMANPSLSDEQSESSKSSPDVDHGHEGVWSGDLGYPDDPSSLLRIERLRVFPDSVLVVATSASSDLGHWEFEARLSELEDGESREYVGENIIAVAANGRKVRSWPFALSMCLHREDAEMQVTGEWREGGTTWPFEGTLLLE